MKRILVIVIVLLVLMGALPLALYVAADPAAVATSFAQTLSDKTHRQLAIKGGADFSLLPTPHFTFNEVMVQQPPSASSLLPVPYTVAQVKAYPQLFSLFGTPKIDSLVLVQPLAKWRVTPQGERNWSIEDAGLLTALGEYTNGTIEIESGILELQDAKNNLSFTVRDIMLSAEAGKEALELSGSFNADAGEGEITWQTPQEGKAKIQISAGKTSGSYEGDFRRTTEGIELAGNWSFHTPQTWLVATAEEAPMFDVAGNVTKHGNLITFENVTAKGKNTDGKISASLTWEDSFPFRLEAAFNSIDIGNPWQKKPTEQASPAAPEPQKSSNNWFSLIGRLSGEVKFTTQQLLLAGQAIANVQVLAQVEEGEINISQAFAAFPGDATAAIIGIIRPEGQGISLDAGVEASGKSFYRFLSTLIPTLHWLPQSELSAFKMKGNIFLSPEENRVSELRLQAGNIQIAGAALTKKTSKVPTIEWSLGLRNVNGDAFIDAWRAHRSSSLDATARTLDGAPDFNWLNQLKSQWIFNARLDDFTLFGTPGSTALFRLIFEPSRATLDITSAETQAWAGKGSFGLATLRQVPELSVSLFLQRLDLPAVMNFLPPLLVGDQLKNGVWSTKHFNFGLIENYNGSFDVKSDTLRFSDTATLSNFSTKGTLANNKLTLSELNGKLWGGNVSLTGMLTGGAIPALSANYSLGNVTLEESLYNFLGYRQLTGQASFSGGLQTSGLTPYEWAQKVEGEMNVLGRGVRVNGLDIPAIIRAMVAARSAADLVNLSQLGLGSGATEISQMKGLFRIKEGLISTLTTEMEGEGMKATLNGSFSLPQWAMDAVLNVVLTGLTTDNPPTLGVQIKGPADQPSVTLDARALEEYITRITSEQILRGGE